MTWSLLKESAFVSHELVLVYIWHEQFLRCSWPQLHGRRCCVAGNLQMRDGLICLIAENCTCVRICIIFKSVPFCFRCLVHPYSHSIVQVNMQNNGTKFHNSHKSCSQVPEAALQGQLRWRILSWLTRPECKRPKIRAWPWIILCCFCMHWSLSAAETCWNNFFEPWGWEHCALAHCQLFGSLVLSSFSSMQET